MPNITLERFMIFNSSEGCSEGRESEKLLYHWTKKAFNNKVSNAEQIDDVCLCDASVNVSNRLQLANVTKENVQLNQDGKSLLITFENTLVLIVEVEASQSIWMAAHVAPPNAPTNSSETPKITSPCSTRDLSSIPADAIQRVINNLYSRFCLLNGTFRIIAQNVVKSQPNNKNATMIIRDKIRSICQDYFDRVLPNVHLNSMVSNVASLYNYILYLDLNHLVLMRVNSFINHLVCLDARVIRNTIVIFNDQLLWSSLNMHDTRLLYNYLVSVLIREALQEELSSEVDKVRIIKYEMPINLTDNGESTEEMLRHTSESRQTKVHLNDNLKKFYLTVFRSSNNITLSLILGAPNQSNLIQKCEQFLTSDTRLGVIPLVSLGQSVGQSFLKANHYGSQLSATHLGTQSQVPTSSNSRSSSTKILKSAIPADQNFIHIDRLNLSISWPTSIDMQNKEYLLLSQHEVHSTNQVNNRKLGLIRYLIELEPELYQIKRHVAGDVEEFLGRTLDDSWITVTNSNYQTIYSVHDVKNSGLSEAQQTAKNLKSII